MEQQVRGVKSEGPKRPADISDLTEEQVEQYLRHNPKFFVGKDRLLKQMRLPHASGKAISLLERQNQLFREESQSLEQRLMGLIDNARDNDRLFNRLRSLVLDILTIDSIDQLASQIRTHLTQYFNVDDFRLLVSEFHQTDSQSIQGTADLALLPDLALLSDISDLVRLPKASCGQYSEALRNELLASEHSSQSLAVASLHYQGFHGLIVLGSKDSQYFSNSMDTLFLSYLAEVVARLLFLLSSESEHSE